MQSPTALRVLVVDDDRDAVSFVERVLGSYGDEVVAAYDPSEALSLLRSDPVDLFLVSLTLPDDGGLALVHHLRALNPDSDLIVLASASDPTSVAQAASLSVAMTVLKPLSGDDLLVAVDRVRERRLLLSEHAETEVERESRRRRASAYRRCLPFVEDAEPSLLPEMIVDVFNEEFAAEAVALYVRDADDPQRLRLAGTQGGVLGDPPPTERRISRLPERDALRGGEVVSVDADGRHLLVPLHASHTMVGLVDLRMAPESAKADPEAARVVADLAGAALRNARRFEALAKSGIKDPQTSAYTFAYFVDHAGREIDKARRYGRQFSLGILSLDGFENARAALGREGVHRLSLEIIEGLLGVVRDTDVVARVEDDEIYVFMPETGFLGALTLRRRIEEWLVLSTGYQEAARTSGLCATMGVATYPADGADLSMLLRRCRDSADRLRQSTLRRLGLQSSGFWEVLEAVVGDPESYAIGRDGRFFLHRSLRAAEDEIGLCHHLLAPPPLVDHIAREILRESSRRNLPSVLYGDAGTPDAPSHLLSAAGTPHVWVVGAKGSGHDEGSVGRAMWLDDPRLAEVRFLLHLGERGAYGLVARRTPSDELAAFHTSEVDLVEGLVVRLQAEYHLQRSLF